MKKQIYLYLFLLTALILLFVVVNNKNETKQLYSKVEALETKLESNSKQFNDTIEALRIEAIELGEFSLKEDAYSLEHLYKEGYDADKLEDLIEDQLISLNTEPGGNPLVPFAPMMSDKMLVNNVKMLNYKYAILANSKEAFSMAFLLLSVVTKLMS